MRKLKNIIEGFFHTSGAGLESSTEKFLNEMGITNYVINDGKVHIRGNIDIIDFEGKMLGIQFGRVTGSFHVQNCPNLESLVGFPDQVNSITINFCPKLKSLEGLPKVKYGVNIYACPKLKTLKGVRAADQCDLDLYLNSLPGIKNMTGLEDDISSINIMYLPNLESLEGCPSKVDMFTMRRCPKIKNLVGMPKHITGKLNIRDCEGIISVKGISKEVGREIDIDIYNNFKWDGEMDKVCKGNKSKDNHMIIYTKSYFKHLMKVEDIIDSIKDKRTKNLNIKVFSILT